MNCPVYQANLKYDIEHIDEIEDVTYRLLLKNKLGLPRTEKDNKEMRERMESLEKAKDVLSYSIDKCFVDEV